MELEACPLHASPELPTHDRAPVIGAGIVAEGGGGTDRSVIFVTPIKADLGGAAWPWCMS